PLAVQATASATIVVTAPNTAGTITNSTTVAAPENDTNPSNNSLIQVSDVIPAVNTTNNGRLVGQYAFLFHGFDANGAMASVGSFTPGGHGSLAGGLYDENRASGATTNLNFTGSYSIGSDNRGTLTLNFVGRPSQTYRVSLAGLSAQGVATTAHIIEFDNTGTT